MSPMDHAEAHERIADMALEPARLAGLRASDAAQDVALREHVDGCERCRAELAEWHGLHATATDALTGQTAQFLQPIAPPADLRLNVLRQARQSAQTSAPATVIDIRQRRRGLVGRAGLFALAAVFALVAVGTGVLFVRDESRRLDTASIEHQWLSETVSAMNRVLASPDHRVVPLQTADGTSAGSIAWSRNDLVVLAGSLPAPAAGQIYRCWLNYDGTDTAMGVMWFVDGNAFWASSTDDWAPIDLSHDKQFLVTLEPTANTGTSHVGPIVLTATLGG